MPPPAATVSPARGTGKHSLFKAPAHRTTGEDRPPADSEQPIALGVNFDKGVYVVRRVTIRKVWFFVVGLIAESQAAHAI